MSLTLKLTSLFIRTAAKPIGNWLKGQAREHARFRTIAIGFAQRLHRLDMRLKLGLLQDPAAIEKQIAREAAEAAAKKTRTSKVPTVKTAEETKEEEAATKAEKKAIEKEVKEKNEKSTNRLIRPLSESKAIDSGATFISEAFLFMVAGGLIVFETFRSRRKEGIRRDQVEGRLMALEGEINRCREQEEASEEVVKKLQEEVDRLRGEKMKVVEEGEQAAQNEGGQEVEKPRNRDDGQPLSEQTEDGGPSKED